MADETEKMYAYYQALVDEDLVTEEHLEVSYGTGTSRRGCAGVNASSSVVRAAPGDGLATVS